MGSRYISHSLASVGIYGMVSYEVTRRTSEIGIRMALGAIHADILKLVLSEVVFVSLLGISLGAFGAISLSRLVRGLIFGIDVADPRVELVSAAILLSVALAAATMPALRAARLDPAGALRAD